MDQQSLLSMVVLWKNRKFDYATFMRELREKFMESQQTGDYVPAVIQYYTFMADFITAASGPMWHFVPDYPGLSRTQSHEKFNQVVCETLGAKPGDKILEIGCGFGNIGRRVAEISGASVTGLTMGDNEVEEGNRRAKEEGLADRCEIVQGNYHSMPFKDKSFDKIFGIYTVKYSVDVNQVFKEMKRLLKPGGLWLSYEILVTDKYDPTNAYQRKLVETISTSTCMPPLWHGDDFRKAGDKVGMKLILDKDLCTGPKDQWYRCFTKTGVAAAVECGCTRGIMKFAESSGLFSKGFSDFYETCIVHPMTDFVHGGRMKIISGSVLMGWTKP